MTRAFLVPLGVGLLLSACTKEAPPAAPLPIVKPPPSKVSAAPQGEAVSNTARVNFEPSAPIAPREQNQPPSRDEIYEATRKFGMEQRRPAASLEELVSKGYLKPIPPPPPGKKYVLNQRGASLMVVDK